MSAVGAKALKLVGQLAGNPRAALGQLDGSKQVASLVGAGGCLVTLPLELEARTLSFQGRERPVRPRCVQTTTEERRC